MVYFTKIPPVSVVSKAFTTIFTSLLLAGATIAKTLCLLKSIAVGRAVIVVAPPKIRSKSACESIFKVSTFVFWKVLLTK